MSIGLSVWRRDSPWHEWASEPLLPLSRWIWRSRPLRSNCMHVSYELFKNGFLGEWSDCTNFRAVCRQPLLFFIHHQKYDHNHNHNIPQSFMMCFCDFSVYFSKFCKQLNPQATSNSASWGCKCPRTRDACAGGVSRGCSSRRKHWRVEKKWNNTCAENLI